MNYPHHVNDWELYDNDSMLYFKPLPSGFAFIDLTWMDITREDPEYGTGKEYCVCVSEEDGEFEEAHERFADLHHTDSYCISEIVSREDAEKIILKYMEEN